MVTVIHRPLHVCLPTGALFSPQPAVRVNYRNDLSFEEMTRSVTIDLMLSAPCAGERLTQRLTLTRDGAPKPAPGRTEDCYRCDLEARGFNGNVICQKTESACELDLLSLAFPAHWYLIPALQIDKIPSMQINERRRLPAPGTLTPHPDLHPHMRHVLGLL
jgi:hypothetical protein